MLEHSFKQLISAALFLSLTVWLSDDRVEAAQYIGIFTLGAYSGLWVAKDYEGIEFDPKPIILAVSVFFFILAGVLR